jgi:cell division protein FtsI (penicillin-binding protein 3)
LTVLVAPRPLARRASETRHAAVATAHLRLMILLLVFAAGVLAILGRLAVLGLTAEPMSSRDTAAALTPLRGDIVDRNGTPLARTIDGWSIGVRPHQVIGDKVVLARRMGELMPEHSAAYYLSMLNSDRGFVYLRRRAAPELVNAINALGEPGIAYAREPERLYPQSTLAAHVLGYIDMDGRAVTGMEKVLEPRLLDKSARGTPAALSIDARVQAAMESELGRAMTDFKAAGAAGVILDVQTGEVIAMASAPTFNPNSVNQGVTINNVTQSVYELGSTFKPIAIATAIDDGVVTDMSRRFDATKPMQVAGYQIHDDRGDEQNRWLNIPETLVYSSNIATARIVDEVGSERMQAMFRKLGFDTPPAIEIGKAHPLWPAFWGRLTTMTTGYGHGIAVTPLHLASAYAALVNGGTWRPATLVKVDPGKAVPGRRVISEATSARMRQLLRMIVLEGTGKNANVPGYRVGGKTGTGEKSGAGGYSRTKNVSTFAAAFPMDAPRYVVVTMLDSPTATAESRGQRTAGWTAAPVAGRIILRTGAMLGVTPDEGRDIDVSELAPLIWHGDKAPQ